MGDSLTFRIDPHVHSDGSYDCREPVDLILEHASEIGLDGVVVTDHDVLEESIHAADLAPEYGLVGIPGVEVSTAHGHLLAIGVDERPESGRSMVETVRRVRGAGGVAIIPHPFQRSRHGIRKRRLRRCAPDAIEVYNSMLFTGYRNRRANAFAARNDFAMIGASDAHYVPNIGRAYTEITIAADRLTGPKAAATGDDIIQAIREGETVITGRRTPIHRSVRQYGLGAMRKGTYLVTSKAPFLPVWPAKYGE